MKFFDQTETPIRFEHVKLKRTSEGHKSSEMEFSITITDKHNGKLPTYLAAAYSQIKKASSDLDLIEFRADVTSRNVDFLNLPSKDGGSAVIRLAGVDLSKLRLEWHDLREQDPEVRPYFTVSHPLDKAIGSWILDNFGNDLWATFGEAQQEMFEPKQADIPQPKLKSKAAKKGK